ncbi:hypothetical protein [Nonomuraea candida]|uniref:hypothetical protein n=1 Tax=Nonomuraea candida TaxID=359159 RepID=UPI0005B8E68D|nr:hypothetical protein [Nonomuraea candida]
MADHWEPIRIFDYLGENDPGEGTTRDQVVSWLNEADPDRIESAGKSFVNAAKLIRGEDGVQGALMRAAEELSSVWRGEGATTALESLRLLYASAGALGAAMHDTGAPMEQYAQQVRQYRATMPADTILENAGGGMTHNGGNYGANGGSGFGTGQPGYTPPPVLEGDGGGMTGGPSNEPIFTPDEAARRHLKSLNEEIARLNSSMAEGLAFRLPDITVMDVSLQQQGAVDVGSGSRSGGGETTYWNGGGSGAGGTGPGGSGSGSGGAGGTGGAGSGAGNSGGSGADGGTDPSQRPVQPQDPDGTTPGQDQDQPGSTDPQDPSAPRQPGDSSQEQPAGQDQDAGDQPQDVPAVIGDDRTQLAENTPAPGPGTSANPGTSTNPNAWNPATTTTPPPTLTNPVTGTPYGNQPNGGMWYGTNSPAAAATPAVLRGGGVTGTGSGFMAYPPGGAAPLSGESDEHTREYYDSERDMWSVSIVTGPDKLG